MNRPNDAYVTFASQVSFLELGDEEFGPALIDTSKFVEEITILASKSDWIPGSLAEFVTSHPGSFKVLEAVLQQQRFTDPQLIHFFFDVVKMNSTNLDAVYQYAVMNIDHDNKLRQECDRALRNLDAGTTIAALQAADNEDSRKLLVAAFKIAVNNYASKIPGKADLLRLRVSEPVFKDTSYRFSDYLIHRLKLNDVLGAANLGELLRSKRTPIDTKSRHGKYAKQRAIEILERSGFVNIDPLLGMTRTLTKDITAQIGGSLPVGRLFCTERYVEGVMKPKENKPKRFDVIVFSGSRPRHLFEINFYTTSGSKIGINEGEYTDLKNAIDSVGGFEFHWITDGNYWLSSGGRDRYLRLRSQFRNIYNLNEFGTSLSKFL